MSPIECSGVSGAAPVVIDQVLYAPNAMVGFSGNQYNAETGVEGASYSADSPPAFTATTGYFLQGGTLRGITSSNSEILWGFTGDGHLTGAPVAVNQYVFIGSSSGNVYAVDGTSGHQVWSTSLSAPIGSNVSSMPFSNLSAGDGLLVVPSGTKVTAFVLTSSP